MPKVGKKKFAYSKAGKKKAKAHAKKTGQKVVSKPSNLGNLKRAGGY